MLKQISPRELKRICKMQEKCSDCVIPKQECYDQILEYRQVNNVNPCYWNESDFAENKGFKFKFTIARSKNLATIDSAIKDEADLTRGSITVEWKV